MPIAAFAPGHISGFFEPIYRQKAEQSGSRGSGINLSLGAISAVTVNSITNQAVEVFINGKKAPAPVTQLAIKKMIGDTAVHVRIDTKMELPTGQGFGMSGAGALSACLALAKTLQIPKEQAIKASHSAEVQLKTGLADVLASSFGGVEIRREAGLPPWGVIEHIPAKFDLVLCVIGKKIDTKKVLSETTRLQQIAAFGRLSTKKLIEHPSVENMFALSKQFTVNTQLASIKVLQALEAVEPFGLASMCMLGNSIFASGDTHELFKTLSTFGKVYICTIDDCGARILE